MDYKKLSTPSSTITRDMNSISENVGNVYETVVIIGKRANQIDAELKVELDKKLQEFASYSDTIEEVFENREQIEISRYYEKMPKATLLATQEFIEDKVFYRNPLKDKLKKWVNACGQKMGLKRFSCFRIGGDEKLLFLKRRVVGLFFVIL